MSSLLFELRTYKIIEANGYTWFVFTQAGEERFSITMDEKEDVWYEILSFSKPANFLSLIGYPYVCYSQKKFAHESTTAMKKHLSA